MRQSADGSPLRAPAGALRGPGQAGGNGREGEPPSPLRPLGSARDRQAQGHLFEGRITGYPRSYFEKFLDIAPL